MSRKRESGPQHGAGYGPPCPLNPDHGRLVDVLSNGRLVWLCPHADHKVEGGKSIFTEAEAFRD